MKARQRDWIMVRIKRGTHDLLRRLGAQWYRDSAWRTDVPAPNERGEVSIDRIIRELVARDDAHRQRAKAQGERRKRKREGDERPEAKPG